MVNFYTSIFKNSKIGNITRYGKEGHEIHGRRIQVRRPANAKVAWVGNRISDTDMADLYRMKLAHAGLILGVRGRGRELARPFEALRESPRR